ncbi:5870_t:CDS:10 [Paraglomus occultum]|uniref:serine C-palmitoyltransferase n=1 Tax=Paraglomus occultum TaxID=144539 RepID=A0A9N9BKT2_9GLOM|nr:5870_t:CDS:10 [Paraglomus occultum]
MATSYPALNELFIFLNATLTQASIHYSKIPGSTILLKYVKNSYQNDPFRSLLELFLVFFALKYLFSKTYRTDNFVELTEQEVEELVDEWRPEPLVSSLTEYQKWELDQTPTIIGSQGPKPKLANGKTLINLASFDFLGFSTNDSIKEKAIETLRSYGVGSCGPPGFYGTLDVHMKFERDISEFLGTEDAIIYSQSFSTISSAIPSFCKRGDIIVAQVFLCLGLSDHSRICKGVQISRSTVKWYNHNDMEDLERVLKEIQDNAKNRRLTRRFIVTEGISEYYGDIAPLHKLIELKKKYKYRLILDESLSIGTLGRRGAGLTDYFNINSKEVDMIVGSMCNALSAAGGFCAGSCEITEHQRISGLAYCYSASLPAMLAVSATESLSILSQNPQLLVNLNENVGALKNVLENVKYIILDGDKDSPVIHIRLRQDVVNIADVEGKERALQEIVDEAMNNGILLARAKYVRLQELFYVEPSIRICVSAFFTRKDIDKAAAGIKNAIVKVFKNRSK